MKAYFRTEASLETGMGHLMRCLALAQVLAEQHVECTFVVTSETKAFCRTRHDWDFAIVELPKDVTLAQESDWLKNKFDIEEHDLLILDSYRFTSEYIDSLATLPASLLLFDDTNDRGPLNVDLVLNSAGGASLLGYEQTTSGALLCLGDKYRLLRREFFAEQPKPLFDRHSLTIVMGGTDSKKLSLAFLQALELQAIDLPVRLVLTSDNPQLPEIKSFIAHTNLPVQLVLDCQDLAMIFANSRLTISAAGATQFELLAMHCPSLLLVVADNQVNAAQASQAQGWCQYFDFRQDFNVVSVVSEATKLYANDDALQKMMDAAESGADLEGSSRILDKIAQL